MLAAAIFIVAVLGWIVLRRRADASVDLSRRDRQHAALLRLAATHALHVAGDVVSGELEGVAFRAEAGTRGMLFDGDVVLSASCSSDIRLVAWPREPPDGVTEGLGRERMTGDEVFDARFAVFASPRGAVELLDAETRKELVGLVAAATCIRGGEVMLLLPGIPSGRTLLSSVRLVGRIAERCKAIGPSQV